MKHKIIVVGVMDSIFKHSFKSIMDNEDDEIHVVLFGDDVRMGVLNPDGYIDSVRGGLGGEYYNDVIDTSGINEIDDEEEAEAYHEDLIGHGVGGVEQYSLVAGVNHALDLAATLSDTDEEVEVIIYTERDCNYGMDSSISIANSKIASLEDCDVTITYHNIQDSAEKEDRECMMEEEFSPAEIYELNKLNNVTECLFKITHDCVIISETVEEAINNTKETEDEY